MAARSVLGASAAASSVVAGPASSSSAAPQRCPRARAVALRLATKPKLRLLYPKVCRLGVGSRRSSAVLVKSQLTEVVDTPTNAPVAADSKPDVLNGDGAEPPAKEAATSPMSEEAVLEFMNQVASLVKLVDSRDIVELQLKQKDCELVIRKEASPQTAPPAPVVLAQHHGLPSFLPPQFLTSPPAAPAPAAPAAASALQAPPRTAASTATSVKSSLPPLKSPMAGTFYRNPGPGQPPFVKVGDKVNKGQVLCIIEAMKLMNEIEADQAGTITDILVDDAKPVSLDQPLFIIEP